MVRRIFNAYLADGTTTQIIHNGNKDRESAAVADILSRKYCIDVDGDYVFCRNIVKLSLKEEVVENEE